MTMLVSLILLFVLAGSGHPALPPTPTQAATPGLAAVIHRAYRYSAKGALKPSPGTQIIAVDIEFQGSTSGLDLDDVEIIDASTRTVLDAAPEIAFLNPDGSFYAWHKAPPNGPRRCLLLFQVPERVRSILLQHWGESFSKSPIKVKPSGPTLPAEHPGAQHAVAADCHSPANGATRQAGSCQQLTSGR